MAISNTIIIRLLQLIHETDEKNPINANQIKEKLEAEYGLTTTRQSLYEMIRVLQDCDYPIQSCTNKNGGWYMASHEFEDYQLKIMMDAVTRSRCLSEKEATEITRQLLNTTGSRGKRKLLSVYTPTVGNKSETTQTKEYLDTILEAALAEKKIAFNYTYRDKDMKRCLRMQDGKPKLYELNVFALQGSNDNYYVIGGHDHHKPELTHYRIDRMENLHISDKRMIVKKDFLGDNPDYKIQSYLDSQVDHFAGNPIWITLEFELKDHNMDILADFIGSHSHIKAGDKGKIQVTFRKDDTPTLMGWLLKYGSRFKILEPVELRERLVEEAGRIVELYKEA